MISVGMNSRKKAFFSFFFFLVNEIVLEKTMVKKVINQNKALPFKPIMVFWWLYDLKRANIFRVLYGSDSSICGFRESSAASLTLYQMSFEFKEESSHHRYSYKVSCHKCDDLCFGLFRWWKAVSCPLSLKNVFV